MSNNVSKILIITFKLFQECTWYNWKLSNQPFNNKLNKNKKLYLLIDKFTEIDLHPSKIDNHQMGSLYEELLRKFSKISNEESGDHCTKRYWLLVSFVFEKKNLQGKGKIRSVYDCCCGTGGILTIGKEWIKENINQDLKVELRARIKWCNLCNM